MLSLKASISNVFIINCLNSYRIKDHHRNDEEQVEDGAAQDGTEEACPTRPDLDPGWASNSQVAQRLFRVPWSQSDSDDIEEGVCWVPEVEQSPVKQW